VFLFRNLKEEVSKIFHHMLIDVIERENFCNSRNGLLRDILLGEFKFLSSYVELLEDLMDEEGQVFHEHFILSEEITFDQTEDLSEGRGRDVETSFFRTV